MKSVTHFLNCKDDFVLLVFQKFSELYIFGVRLTLTICRRTANSWTCFRQLLRYFIWAVGPQHSVNHI